MITILFSSAGRRTELLKCFRADAETLHLPLRILATDIEPNYSAACHTADAAFSVPRCTEPSFIPTLLEICRKEEVKLLIPTIDTELETLAANRQEFLRIGTYVQVSEPDVICIARNKFETARFLNAHAISTPKTGTVEEVLSDPGAWKWPLILKPSNGSSSNGIVVAKDLDSFVLESVQRRSYVVQERWTGREYTINLFFDQAGELRCSVPHLRLTTRTGEVSKGITERHPALMDLAEKLGGALKGVRGTICFQSIVSATGDAMIFEINARFCGGYPISHRAGATFSKWLLEEISGRPCTAVNKWQDRLMMLRYDAAVFASAPSGSVGVLQI